MCRFMTPFALSKSWLGFLAPGVFDGIDTHPKDVLGKVSIRWQLNDGLGMKAAMSVSGHEMVCTVVHGPVGVVELVL